MTWYDMQWQSGATHRDVHGTLHKLRNQYWIELTCQLTISEPKYAHLLYATA